MIRRSMAQICRLSMKSWIRMMGESGSRGRSVWPPRFKTVRFTNSVTSFKVTS